MPNQVPDVVSQSLRYALAALGPVASAAVQFALSLVLLRIVDQAAFGRISFLLVASQLCLGVWSALLCAPLPVLLAQDGDGAARTRLLSGLYAVNLFGAGLAYAVFVVLGTLAGDPAAAPIFAGFAAVGLLRWFARAHAYATGAVARTVRSDLVYSAVLAVGVVVMAVSHTGSVARASFWLLAAALAGLLPFGLRFLRVELLRASPRAIPAYRAVWRDHARWSLLGVVTTEATANAHAYLVTLLLGPAAFAPVAAAALLIRPITVAMNALTDFERPQMARQIAARQYDQAHRAARFFLLVLVLVWFATCLLTAAILWFAPRLVFPARYDIGFLANGSAAWLVVALVRLLRMPDSTLLQAAGAFRPLALASGWSSLVSVAMVLVLLLAGGPLWSIGGILAGEILFALSIWRQRRRWFREAA